MNLCVIICEKDRPKDLGETLASIENQTRKPDSLVVSDDGDYARTEQVLANFPSLPITHLKHEHSTGLTCNRNYAVSHTPKETTHIMFLDNDVCLNGDYIENIEKAFLIDDTLVGVTGFIWTCYSTRNFFIRCGYAMLGLVAPYECPASFFSPIVREQSAMFPVFSSGRPAPAEWLSGCNMTYAASVFRAGYRFDETMTGYCAGEDVAFSNGLHKQGYQLRMIPGAKLVHKQRGFLGGGA